MVANVELLNYVYQNSQMGLDTINQIEEIVKDTDFKTTLQSQINEYRNINNAATEKLHQKGCEEKGISKLAKISTYMSINMQTIKDKSPSHISSMLIEGSTKGIIDATKNLKKYSNEEKESLDLLNQLLVLEQGNVEELKRFL